ncbi:MAG: queuosine precursor transporter [Deltaproteobacteria bacterium]|jgi:uncharacterized integral membrane protein (TIGR00697 family)|nr:queuosine precursor transporter [Deltaproteobacteria bacterium]
MPHSPVPTKYLEIITGLFTGLLVISTVCSNRLVAFGPLEFDAGTLVFPLTYILDDLLTEVYGFRRTRRVIWTGFLVIFVFTVCLRVSMLLPPPAGWDGAAAFDAAMALTPRLALGSLLAYLAGEFANSAVLAKMKAKNPNRGPVSRFLFSTVVGQGLDTLIFSAVAFLGVLDARLWLVLVVSNYVYKVGLEILLLPLTVRATAALKKAEGLDVVDIGIGLNPFGWKLDQKTKP